MEEEKKEETKLKKIDGINCIVLPEGVLLQKVKKKPQFREHPFRFTQVQEFKDKAHTPAILDELKRMFERSTSFNFKLFKITEDGKTEPADKEDLKKFLGE